MLSDMKVRAKGCVLAVPQELLKCEFLGDFLSLPHSGELVKVGR